MNPKSQYNIIAHMIISEPPSLQFLVCTIPSVANMQTGDEQIVINSFTTGRRGRRGNSGIKLTSDNVLAPYKRKP
jgi:hypothetical protein